MSKKCCFCGVIHPHGGIKRLFVSSSKEMVGFCSPCGERIIMTNPITNEEITISSLYERSSQTQETNNDD